MVYEFENGPRNLEKLTSKEMDEARKKIQIVFQEMCIRDRTSTTAEPRTSLFT